MYPSTLKFLFNNMSNRVKYRRKNINKYLKDNNIQLDSDKKRITQEYIDPNLRSIVSLIENNNPSSNNEYLIPYGLLCTLVDKLEFKNNQEIIWGEEDEIIYYGKNIFNYMIKDCIQKNLNSDISNNQRNLLMSSFQYCLHLITNYYVNYCKFLHGNKEFDFMNFYIDRFLSDFEDEFLIEAIMISYYDLEEVFIEEFIEFTNSVDDTKFLDRKIDKFFNNFLLNKTDMSDYYIFDGQYFNDIIINGLKRFNSYYLHENTKVDSPEKIFDEEETYIIHRYENFLYQNAIYIENTMKHLYILSLKQSENMPEINLQTYLDEFENYELYFDNRTSSINNSFKNL
ncbi:Uncharacterised protein [Anaerococcus octavius]|uniref:Uncharacterized protein n=1 Tax=Anaerococcus octavius TaxID=54007 RepID=A0A380WVD5_9FIRM|nr:hypothetical protein [Anaerococcus octavius]SUU92978.1 Uncharacterised protein [Anaerococcus octavius]